LDPCGAECSGSPPAELVAPLRQHAVFQETDHQEYLVEVENRAPHSSLVFEMHKPPPWQPVAAGCDFFCARDFIARDLDLPCKGRVRPRPKESAFVVAGNP
jgi:hypothetical protein